MRLTDVFGGSIRIGQGIMKRNINAVLQCKTLEELEQLLASTKQKRTIFCILLHFMPDLRGRTEAEYQKITKKKIATKIINCWQEFQKGRKNGKY